MREIITVCFINAAAINGGHLVGELVAKKNLKIAKDAPCVIVGHCADYVLRVSDEFDDNDILNIFIYADEAAKIERAIKAFNTPEKDAKKFIAQVKKPARTITTRSPNTRGASARITIC